MIAGDAFQRNFTWPIPDPPQSLWFGAQGSQEALRQKAIGFNCMNYNIPTQEGTLKRHFMPSKEFLDANCPDGLRLEVMFPSCWNGKDVDSDDHKSHMAYPHLVMDGTCPEGYETRVVSLMFETIWNTYAFKDMSGKFVLSHGDPTGFGYHGDFIQGWEPGVLQKAVDTCTNPSGQVEDCPIFQLQSQDDQRKCKFEVPDGLKDENVHSHQGLPGGVMIEDGPAYAFPIKYTNTPAAPTPSPTQTPDLLASISAGVDNLNSQISDGIDNLNTQLGLVAAETGSTSSTSSTPSPSPTSAPTTTSISTPTPTPTPVTSYIEGPVTKLIVHVEREIILECDGQGKPLSTVTGDLRTLSTDTTTVTQTVSTDISMETPEIRQREVTRVHKRHGHGHGHLHRRGHMD